MTQASPFRAGPALDASRVTVLGWSDDLRSPPIGLRELLDPLLKDARVRVIEVAEYASLRDLDHAHVNSIIELLAGGLADRCRWSMRMSPSL